MGADITEFLEETGITRAWIEVQPCLLNEDIGLVLQRIEDLCDRFDVVPLSGISTLSVAW